MNLVQLSPEPIQPLEFGGVGLKTTNRGYYVYVTEACNLRCNYCFVDDKHNHNHLFDPVTYAREADQPDMVLEVVNYILNDPDGRSSKYVHFFGGEPLIRWQSIDRFIRLIQAGQKEMLPKCKITYGITTNGTLLTEDACKMLKQHEVGVQLSLDGSEEGNDVHRQLMGGNQQSGNVGAGNGEGLALRKAGAFHMVKVDNYLKYFGDNARMTLTPGNLPYLTKSIRELGKLGFKSFSVIPNSDSGEWDGHWEELERALSEMFDYSMGSNVLVNMVQQVWDKLLKRQDKSQTHLCQAGRNVVGISVRGDLWPCHDFLGKYQKDPASVSALQIGHISKGYTLNTAKFEHLECDDEVKSGAGYDCKTCHARSMCDRGCPYINYTQGQAVKTVNPTYCRTTRIMADIALRYMLLHPDKYQVAVASKTAPAQLGLRERVAIAYFEQQAPAGRNGAGQPLLPGEGGLKALGLDGQGLPLNGSPQPTSAGQPLPQKGPINGPRDAEAEVAGWDGERGLPSPIPQKRVGLGARP